MKCPQCNSTQTTKNGHRRGRQCYKCKQCSRQFLESYRPWRYSADVKRLCILMYLNGMGLRGIERVTDIHHTTVMHWIREAGHQLHDAPESEAIPEVSDLDELQTFVGNKRNQLWIGCAVNHKQPGILAWVIGDRSAATHAATYGASFVAGSAFGMSPMDGRYTRCLSRMLTIW